ncbi:hypothetical protein IFM89_008997 [Coptis chinensis]|uniref:DUF4283 domain-containing protein n=1 Tax=Coptis chinensis TaxID=261450 RepID=A0A835HRX5_9MAGN|nr:hypothetical protein IFM89_008997 [Coptis chinensis]
MFYITYSVFLDVGKVHVDLACVKILVSIVIWIFIPRGFFVEKRLSYLFVKDAVQKQWKLTGDFTMMADKNLFYFKFVNDEDKQRVIDHEPLFLAGRIFVVRPWTPSIDKYRNGIKALPIWIRVDLPKHLWTKNVVDIEFKFPSFIPVKIGEGDIVDIGLDYEWVLDLCTSCKIFGHSDSKCIKNKEVSAQNPVIQPQMARTQVHNKPRKQHMRWMPKKNTLTGQTSCLRDKNGTIVTNDGQNEDTPVIITEEVGQTQERTYREVTEALAPTVRGSQVVVHSEVQASNIFAVLMPEDEEAISKMNKNCYGDKFEEVRTEFEPSEVGSLNTEGEEGNSEDSKEKKVYSIKRGEIRQEDSYSVSEEEFEKEYFSDHLDAEEDSEVARMLESPPINARFEDKERNFEELLQEERKKAKKSTANLKTQEDDKLRREEIANFIQSQAKGIKEFEVEREKLIKMHEDKKAEIKCKYLQEELELEKNLKLL